MLLPATALAVDPAALWAVLARVDAGPLLLALPVVAGQILASAWRWRFTAGRLGLDLPFGPAAADYHLSSLLNMVLPGGMAGDVMRALRSRHAGGGPPATRAAVRAVVLERLAGQAAFAVMAAGGLAAAALAGLSGAPPGAAALVLAVPAVMAAGAAAVAVAGRVGPAPVRAALADLGPDFRRAFGERGAWAVQGGVSLLIAASYVAVFALAAEAVGAPLPPVGLLVLVPLTLLSMLVPITVGGWGLREGTAAALWPLAGLTAAEGAATAALYGAVVIAGALPGLALAALTAGARQAGSSRA